MFWAVMQCKLGDVYIVIRPTLKMDAEGSPKMLVPVYQTKIVAYPRRL
jgi:hypothetical protein